MKEFFCKYKGIILPALSMVVAVVAMITNVMYFNVELYKLLAFISLLSAVIAIISSGFAIVYEILRITKGVEKPKYVTLMQFVTIVETLFSFVVFFCFNTPTYILAGYTAYIFTLENMLLHPVLSAVLLLDWCFNVDARDIKKIELLYPTFFAILYLAYVYIGVACGLVFGVTASRLAYPYPFIDVTKNGLFSLGDGKLGVAYIFIVAGAVLIGLSFFVRFISRKILDKKEKADCQAK